jgi:hypothetical protein
MPKSKFPKAVEPYDHTVFMILKLNDRFRFATEITFPTACPRTGVAVKDSTTQYHYQDDPPNTYRAIGQQNAVVIRVDENGNFRKKLELAADVTAPVLFEVPIVYRGQCNYLVPASNKEEAEAIARAKFSAGAAPDDLGNEWEEIERVGTITAKETEH